MRYFYYKDEKVLGPVNAKGLEEMYRRRALNDSTPIIKEDDDKDEWLELGKVFRFSTTFRISSDSFKTPFQRATDLLKNMALSIQKPIFLLSSQV